MPLMLNREQRALLREAHATAAELAAGANTMATAAMDAFLTQRESNPRAAELIATAAAGAADSARKITALRMLLNHQGILPDEPRRCGRIRRLENTAAGSAAAAREWEKSMSRYVARVAGDADLKTDAIH